MHGWLQENERAWLAEAAAGKRLVVEFGAWCGKSTVALAGALEVISVDTFLGTPGDNGNHERLIADGLRPAAEWRAATAHLPNVFAIVGDLRRTMTQRLLLAFAGSVDLVYIDADHSYQHVFADINLALRLVRPDGVVCGHDYDSTHPGVMQAVDEKFPNRRLPAEKLWVA
jgi:predicted O-methyltransferase YrrM